MPLRDPTRAIYLPLLDVRPAELLALEELPNKDKDAIFPLFRLRPWVGSKDLHKAVERLNKAFSSRPCFLELGAAEPIPAEKHRQVHYQLDALRNPTEGYRAWVEFFDQEGCEHFMPVAQLENPREFVGQLRALVGLGRGVLVHLDVIRMGDAAVVALARLVNENTDGGQNTIVVLDYYRQSENFLALAPSVRTLVRAVLSETPNARIAVSASSFPDSFTSITRQKIYERELYNGVSAEFGSKLIYSDRGSARAERQAGGGGLPAPRIDYAKSDEWMFYRQDTPVAKSMLGYQLQAKKLMNSDHWDNRLKLWGCQMIEKTAIGDDTGITSASRATAARINIHLHQQLWYRREAELYDTDEEWTDI